MFSNQPLNCQTTEEPSYPVLFVGDLSVTCDETRLKDLFESCGVHVTSLRIMKNKTQSSLGYGFVNVESMEQAQHALKTLNGVLVCGRYLRLGFANPLSSPTGSNSQSHSLINANYQNCLMHPQKPSAPSGMTYDSQNSIHLKFFIPFDTFSSNGHNINQEVDESVIRKIFEDRYGYDCIKDINIRRIQVESTGKKGYGFIHFKDLSICAQVLEEMNCFESHGVQYTLEISKNLKKQLYHDKQFANSQKSDACADNSHNNGNVGNRYAVQPNVRPNVYSNGTTSSYASCRQTQPWQLNDIQQHTNQSMSTSHSSFDGGHSSLMCHDYGQAVSRYYHGEMYPVPAPPGPLVTTSRRGSETSMQCPGRPLPPNTMSFASRIIASHKSQAPGNIETTFEPSQTVYSGQSTSVSTLLYQPQVDRSGHGAGADVTYAARNPEWKCMQTERLPQNSPSGTGFKPNAPVSQACLPQYSPSGTGIKPNAPVSQACLPWANPPHSESTTVGGATEMGFSADAQYHPNAFDIGRNMQFPVATDWFVDRNTYRKIDCRSKCLNPTPNANSNSIPLIYKHSSAVNKTNLETQKQLQNSPK